MDFRSNIVKGPRIEEMSAAKEATFTLDGVVKGDFLVQMWHKIGIKNSNGQVKTYLFEGATQILNVNHEVSGFYQEGPNGGVSGYLETGFLPRPAKLA